MTGTVARVIQDKGFGFIKCGEDDYFFHRSEVDGRFEKLLVGATVEFDEDTGPKGLRAKNVRAVVQ